MMTWNLLPKVRVKTDYSEIKYPVAFLNGAKTNKIIIEEAQNS